MTRMPLPPHYKMSVADSNMWSVRLGTMTMATVDLRFLCLMSSAFPACWILARSPSWLRARRRRRLGLCLRCGYDLRGSPGACSECGFERG
jgi:hypothetical protein